METTWGTLKIPVELTIMDVTIDGQNMKVVEAGQLQQGLTAAGEQIAAAIHRFLDTQYVVTFSKDGTLQTCCLQIGCPDKVDEAARRIADGIKADGYNVTKLSEARNRGRQLLKETLLQ